LLTHCDLLPQLALTEAKLQRTVQTLREARANAITGGPDGVLARAEEELKMNTYLSQEKLPQALAERETLRNELERVANEPAMTNADLDTLHQQVRWLALACGSGTSEIVCRTSG
jgi:intraflagellar transport protein 81